LTDGLALHGDEALRLHPPAKGDRVLDIGCGFGDATQQIAALVGPAGHVSGVDASARFVETARGEAQELGVQNVSFAVADVQEGLPDGPFDRAFSRFGTMFFANPVVALRKVREALVPGGELVMVVWRTRIDNDWLYRAQQIVERIVERPEQYEEPTCGPGPFSMANADTVTDVLLHAGFAGIELRRCDLPVLIGRDLDEAIEMVMAMGPAGEILRLLGDRAAHLHETVRAALREGMADMLGPEGVCGTGSTWIVAAQATREEEDVA
jgi:SAM-dependent methyltransferase